MELWSSSMGLIKKYQEHRQNIVITVSHTWIYKSSLCINKLALSILLTEWGHSSDHSILQWPPQCGDGTPPGGGHHQHHCTGEIQTPPCHGLKFSSYWNRYYRRPIPGVGFCLHLNFVRKMITVVNAKSFLAFSPTIVSV